MVKDGLRNTPKVEVSMLGKFSIRQGENIVTVSDGRTKKVWILVEYLLANRNNDISQEKLIEILWNDMEECDDPYHALKNLVYRARKLLAEYLGKDSVDLIKFARNTYTWNNSFDTVLDIEEFESLWKRASDAENDTEQRIQDYFAAVNLYQGEFLPKSSFVNWVISKSVYYMNIYVECVLKICELLFEKKRFGDVIGICEKAVAIYPFEEPIHKLLMLAYINIGKQSQALTHYEYVIHLFQKEMNVDISSSMRAIHQDIVNSMNAVETDLSIIKNDLQEACNANGAFYCDYEIFKNIYRLLARSMIRTGQSIHVALITLSNQKGEIPEGDVLKVCKERLKDCIVNSLRKGDVVASYSAAQFVVTLPLTTYENSEMVLQRITDRFNAMNHNSAIKINIRLNQVDPV